MILLSELYPEYYGTFFPDKVDQFENMVDVTISTKPAVDRFYQYYNAGDFDNATKVLEDNPILKRMIINADNINKILHAVMAVEQFFYDDVEQYLMRIVKNRGDFDPAQKYTKYDVVFLTRDDAKEAFMGIQLDIPIGTSPTDTRYFVPLALRGKQGASGTGLSPRGVWSSVISYYKDDCVSYNNILWQCNKDCQGVIPREDDNTNWEAILRVPQQVIISDVMPEGQVYNDIWIQDHKDQSFTLYRKNLDGTYGIMNPTTLAANVTFDDDTTVEAFKGHMHAAATTSKDGFLSKTDKAKLDKLSTTSSGTKNYLELYSRPNLVPGDGWRGFNVYLHGGALQIDGDDADTTERYYSGYGIIIGGGFGKDRPFLGPNHPSRYLILGSLAYTGSLGEGYDTLEDSIIIGFNGVGESYPSKNPPVTQRSIVLGTNLLCGTIKNSVSLGDGEHNSYGINLNGKVYSSFLGIESYGSNSGCKILENTTINHCMILGDMSEVPNCNKIEDTIIIGRTLFEDYGQSDSQIIGSASVGYENKISGTYAFAFGTELKARDYNFVVGKRSKTPRAYDDLFIVGNGRSAASNAFRVALDGSVYGTKAFNVTGADYAEMFEWVDGNPDNEDRRGKFVTLDGEKIRLANSNDDYIAGVVSACPSVVSDNYADDWCGKYKKDIFGARLEKDPVDKADKDFDPWELAQEYNSDLDKSYIPRTERKEWSAVGVVGKLVVCDDGTCVVNGYCQSGENGVATNSDHGYRVMSRIDNSHIKIFLK